LRILGQLKLRSILPRWSFTDGTFSAILGVGDAFFALSLLDVVIGLFSSGHQAIIAVPNLGPFFRRRIQARIVYTFVAILADD